LAKYLGNQEKLKSWFGNRNSGHAVNIFREIPSLFEQIVALTRDSLSFTWHAVICGNHIVRCG